MKKTTLNKRKSKAVNKQHFKIIKHLLKNIPNNSLIFLDYRDILEIFTKKRLELVDAITKNKPESLQQLAKLTKRKKQAINRDLRILEKHEVIKLEKKGKTVIPRLNKKIILYQIKNHESEPIKKQVEA